MELGRYHWRHFFGGVAVLLFVTQFLSGAVLTLFYIPHLDEAYASVQRLYNELGAIAWVRDAHRWAALFLLVALIMHLIRSLLRKDFLGRNRATSWLAGTLVFVPLLGFLVTGMILPWEWRGYWFMEMVPNYVSEIPLIGPRAGEFLIGAFTLNRAFVMHVVVLPAITLVLLDIHALSRMKKRPGALSMYLLEHALLCIPVLLAIAALAYMLPMPSQDPVIVPMPLEGEGIPTAEWFVLLFYVPWLHFKGSIPMLLGFCVPLVLFLVLAVLPFVFGTPRPAERRGETSLAAGPIGRRIASMHALAPVRRILGPWGMTRALGVLSVSVAAIAVFGPFYAVSHVSPTMGCNSCHNRSAGTRMGLPPATFKDRVLNPNLKDNTFMVEHWFYPQVVW